MLTNTDKITIINIDNPVWDSIVRTFDNYDVYYLSGYVKAFKIHGDGNPSLMYYKTDNLEAAYVFFLRETAHTGWYDAITPYGYGGTLFKGDTSTDCLTAFHSEWLRFAKENNIVDNFVRFHPILDNAFHNRSLINVIDLGQTIAMDLTSEDLIWSNISSKNRNMIRKAEKNGVSIHHGKGMELLDIFIEIYNKTMEHDSASDYYYFKHDFYESIDRDLNDNYEIFYAVYDGKIVSMAIMIFANHRMHYHLSGSLFEYRFLAPSNLLLYKAALWGMENGMKTFHLGGGVGSGRDNLYKFKEGFNRNGQHQFSIGKEIMDEEKYNELVRLRESADENFNRESSFFPLYRS